MLTETAATVAPRGVGGRQSKLTRSGHHARRHRAPGGARLRTRGATQRALALMPADMHRGHAAPSRGVSLPADWSPRSVRTSFGIDRAGPNMPRTEAAEGRFAIVRSATGERMEAVVRGAHMRDTICPQTEAPSQRNVIVWWLLASRPGRAGARYSAGARGAATCPPTAPACGAGLLVSEWAACKDAAPRYRRRSARMSRLRIAVRAEGPTRSSVRHERDGMTPTWLNDENRRNIYTSESYDLLASRVPPPVTHVPAPAHTTPAL